MVKLFICLPINRIEGQVYPVICLGDSLPQEQSGSVGLLRAPLCYGLLARRRQAGRGG
jgi:hypothetical protein